MNNIYERCFIFSRTQLERIMEANKRAGLPAPKMGTVIVNGVPKQYTDRVIKMEDAPYADSILLIRGDIRKIKFEEPEF